MKIMTTFAALVAFGLAGSAHAAKYGMAGCGLGSLVIDPDGSQTTAATTNGTFYSQTLGITSGTSNCVDDAASASLDQEAFVRTNYASLMQDAARGQGQYLSAFAVLLGCEASTHPTFFSMSQKNHEQVFNADANATVVVDQMKAQARADATLKASCARL
jgi:hypothetical protein